MSLAADKKSAEKEFLTFPGHLYCLIVTDVPVSGFIVKLNNFEHHMVALVFSVLWLRIGIWKLKTDVLRLFSTFTVGFTRG